MPPLQGYKRELDYTYSPGIFPTLEALHKRPHAVRRVLLSSEIHQSEGLVQIKALCDKHHIRIEQADKILSRISGKDNCFAAAVVVKESTPLQLDSSHLVLCQPSDKGNLGTILRSALGFGYTNIAIISPAADVYDPHVIRACMGAIFSINIQEFDDFNLYRKENPRHHLYPFMLTGSVSLDEATKHVLSPHALVMGNEGAGLPEEFQQKGTPVCIPHSDAIDSLNLAVAASLGMYAFSHAEQKNL